MTLRSTCIVAGALLALASFSPARAADNVSEQHESHCTQEAKALKGDERDRFLAECHHFLGSQQLKMKNCNAEAGRRELHGDERRAFMSTCLKG